MTNVDDMNPSADVTCKTIDLLSKEKVIYLFYFAYLTVIETARNCFSNSGSKRCTC